MRYWHGQSKPPQFAHLTMKKKSPGKSKKIRAKVSRPLPAENILDSLRNSGESGARITNDPNNEPMSDRQIHAEERPSNAHQ